MLDTATVLQALSTIVDPDFKKDIVELGFVRDLKIEDGVVSFTIRLTTPACPIKDQFKRQAEEAVGALPGVREVRVTMDAAPAMEVSTGLPGVAHIVAVIAGKGGVGKSTTAVNLAVALMQMGAKVGLFDADAFGPNTPRMLGVRGVPLRTQGGKIVPIEAQGIKLVSIGSAIPEDQPVVWRGSLQHGFVRDFTQKTEWGELDYLVVDMPPGTGDIPLSVMQLLPLSGALVVGTPQEVALEDVRRGVTMLGKMNFNLLGFVENMSYLVCPNCGEEIDVFGKGGMDAFAETFGAPVLARIPMDVNIRKGSDAGLPAAFQEGPVAEAYKELAAAVVQRVAVVEKENPPKAAGVPQTGPGGNQPFLNVPKKN
ncbi:Mrp/NBP35 family ATP-binding protein [Oceanithermus profundus]